MQILIGFIIISIIDTIIDQLIGNAMIKIQLPGQRLHDIVGYVNFSVTTTRVVSTGHQGDVEGSLLVVF